jgi:Na+-driven multidrug efflux pump
MLQFSIPSIITQVVSSLYNVVDQIFIVQGKKAEASKSAGNVAIASLVSGLALTAVCLFFLEPLCRLLGATDDSISYALDYGSIIAIGFVFTNFAISVSALIRADGSPRYSMAVMISGAVTNTILDPLFIFGFGWGEGGGMGDNHRADGIGGFVRLLFCQIQTH